MVIIISTEGIMGRIKSAWEIALERTENIEVDAEKMDYLTIRLVNNYA